MHPMMFVLSCTSRGTDATKIRVVKMVGFVTSRSVDPSHGCIPGIGSVHQRQSSDSSVVMRNIFLASRRCSESSLVGDDDGDIQTEVCLGVCERGASGSQDCRVDSRTDDGSLPKAGASCIIGAIQLRKRTCLSQSRGT